jgi:hypothetical protein
MSCEAEAARVKQLSAKVTQAAAQCASICAALGHDSMECSGCQGEVADLRRQVLDAQRALGKCLQANPPPASLRLLETTGHVTFLLVVDPGVGYGGGASNWIDVDVIFKLDSRPDKSFGFQLRDDGFQPVRQGMLALLRDAMVHNLKVITDYTEVIAPPNQNSFVIRVALTKLPAPTSDIPPVLGV